MEKRERQKRRGAAVVALALTLTLFGTAALWVHAVLARHPYASPADPETGYRCRFTLSSGWHPQTEQYIKAPDEIWGQNFRPAPPASVTQWLQERLHIGGAAPKARRAWQVPIVPAIGIHLMRGPLPPQLHLSNGQLGINRNAFGGPGITTLFEEKSFQMEGQPALYGVVKSPVFSGRLPFISAFVIIKIQNSPLTLYANCFCTKDNWPQTRAELLAIRDSLHIERHLPR